MDTFLFFLILALLGGLSIGADVIAWVSQMKAWDKAARRPRRKAKAVVTPLLPQEQQFRREGSAPDTKPDEAEASPPSGSPPAH